MKYSVLASYFPSKPGSLQIEFCPLKRLFHSTDFRQFQLYLNVTGLDVGWFFADQNLNSYVHC